MRRRALLPLLALPVLPRAAAALPPEARFNVVREGRRIGTHRVSFAEAGGLLTARTDVDIVVKLAGFTVFRLTHNFTETWAGDQLRAAASRQDRNGTVTECAARAEGGALLVQGPAGSLRLPANAAPLNWWDPRRLEGRPLYDADSGKPLAVTLRRRAEPGGVTLWTSAGEDESQGHYAADGTWLDWKTKGDDGSTVTYERA